MAYLNVIRELVFNYLLNSIGRSEFESQFSPIFYDIEDSNDEGAIQLSYQVEFILAKASEGILSEQQLRSALAQSISGYSYAVKIEDEFHNSSAIQKVESPVLELELSA